MKNDPPINFESLVKAPQKSSSIGGYPYQLSAKDLMRNFVWSTLHISDRFVESSQGLAGYAARKLKDPYPEPQAEGQAALISVNGTVTWLDAPKEGNSALISNEGVFNWLSAPTDGTYVLGAVSGSLKWISTEECP